MTLSKIHKVIDIGDTLHRSGCAPYKIEKYVQHYAHKKGLSVVVQATPTSINYQFPEEEDRIFIKRVKPTSINLGLLANTISHINQEDNSAPPEATNYPSWLIMLANIFIPPSFLLLIGSTINAIVVACLLGFLVWLCQLVCQKERVIIVEFLSALVVGLTVSLITHLGVDLPIWGVCIAAIILFVPGLSIANSLECLAFNDLVSGTSLFGFSLFTFIKLFIGIMIGLDIGDTAWGHTESVVSINEAPQWLAFIALPLLSCSIGIILNARFIDIVYAFPVTILGMWGPMLLDFGSGWIVGTWVTTIFITFYGTWLANTLNLTGAIYIVQGIIILVPGSRVLMGATQSLFNETLMEIPSVGLSALFIFSAIVAGQITAYSIYPPKKLRVK